MIFKNTIFFSEWHAQNILHRWLWWGQLHWTGDFSLFYGKELYFPDLALWVLVSGPLPLEGYSWAFYLCKAKSWFPKLPDRFWKLNLKPSIWIRNCLPASSFTSISISFIQVKNVLLVPSPSTKILGYSYNPHVIENNTISSIPVCSRLIFPSVYGKKKVSLSRA